MLTSIRSFLRIGAAPHTVLLLLLVLIGTLHQSAAFAPLHAVARNNQQPTVVVRPNDKTLLSLFPVNSDTESYSPRPRKRDVLFRYEKQQYRAADVTGGENAEGNSVYTDSPFVPSLPFAFSVPLDNTLQYHRT
jgi:hypothetical protein